MSTHRQILYHIIFGTKYRRRCLSDPGSGELYRYISGIIHNKMCKLYCINGTEDHLHILCDIHPGIALSELVKDIKVASSLWITANHKFPMFSGWQEGYGAFTSAFSEKQRIINYILNQTQHHQTETFFEEYKKFLIDNGVEFDERFLLTK